MIEMTLDYAAELLGEYLGAAWTPHRARVMLAKYDACLLAMEWETFQIHTRGSSARRDDVEFYSHSALYLLELLHWNTSAAFKAYQRELATVSGLKIIDFGAGIGTLSHQLASQDNHVIYCDVNERCFDFAKWWGKKCGTDVTYLLGPGFSISEYGPCDLLLAVDVVEHLEVPTEWLRDVARAVKIGGHLYAKPSWGFQHVYPMHHDHSAMWLGALEQAGFEPKSSGWIERIR